MYGIAWSPTSQRLAYTRYLGIASNPDMTIETCDLAGGARSVVLSDAHLAVGDGMSGIAWLPDGRIIYSIYSGDTESNLWARIAEPRLADPNTGKQGGDAKRLAGWKNFEALDLRQARMGSGSLHTGSTPKTGFTSAISPLVTKVLLRIVSPQMVGSTA